VAAGERLRISILHSGFPNRTPIHLLMEALRALGYEDGSTATIELLGGEGDADRLSALIAHVAAQRPDVIIAITSPAVLGLKHAALPTPVFAFLSDPVGLGIIESAAHPGGNFTGSPTAKPRSGESGWSCSSTPFQARNVLAFSGAAPTRRPPQSSRTYVNPPWRVELRFSRANSGRR
jgi:hypothetical protein